ncbi:iron-containing redox enzyme family protein [Paeniglutamicibacter sp. Y32M11]|uniref:iron-containing redox enzyme family protein n=1 Tax=Paeniglutamicibacter sp. Y32M11 TaxID=2853258 RepID=UPI001C53427D|nr:iron-containing redox enzyme family protein [Paeniglutamicibacter sp. Y32M11]QXQ11968.1 iron-containing redox enzyme family protein [Paeniglutamicibacter sp. Y32M11]
MQDLPTARGPLSEILIKMLASNELPPELNYFEDIVQEALRIDTDIFYSEDLQLALFVLYELHYSGFDQVTDDWEWHPPLLALRNRIEKRFETRLRDALGKLPQPSANAQTVADALFAMSQDATGPSVSSYVARNASLEQVREFLVHKSIYQLKEADPHTWAIPRLSGRAKSALVEIQTDEYGGGIPGRTHAELFARTMQGVDLESDFGAYIDMIPAITLASVNVISLFGLHRRHRGAACGHLAIYEMTSSIPNAKYARGFRRLGFDTGVTAYFDEHVEADAVHEQIAGRDLAGGLIEADPTLVDSVFFGAATVVLLDGLVGQWQMDAWRSGHSSLLAVSRALT